ncbi:hypothetical protein EMPS_mp01 (mitochondrion) [Entomortierella parvispora]|uniref:Uncharacterized protein n=1 Tax=Entomortierella parvispora TaxID=205924 RepID=A0A8J9SUE9_9FUNG|nr:hypothetical protein EMPS_mp01 [Entomortierella parvispora]
MLFLISFFKNKLIRFLIIYILYFIISLIFTDNEVYCMPNDLYSEIFIDVESEIPQPRKRVRTGLIGFLHKVYTTSFEGSPKNFKDMLSHMILLYILYTIIFGPIDLNDDNSENLANFHAFLNLAIIQANNNDQDSRYGTE